MNANEPYYKLTTRELIVAACLDGLINKCGEAAEAAGLAEALAREAIILANALLAELSRGSGQQ